MPHRIATRQVNFLPALCVLVAASLVSNLGSLMTAKYDELPYFDDPPVIETVLGVFFRPVRNFNSVWQGTYWNECLKSDLSDFDLRPPIEEIPERFGPAPVSSGPVFRWEVADAPETPRLWAKWPSGERIFQVQRNALMSNWLRPKGSTEYRRFSARLQELGDRYQQFSEFVAKYKLNEDQPLTPTSCSATYINHIQADSWSAALERTLTRWSSKGSDDWLPPVEQGRLQFSFAFPNQGRLHVTAMSVIQRESKQPVLQLEFTARLVLAKEKCALEDVLQAVATGHEWIVRGFTSLTTPEMHATWRRSQ